VPVRHLADSKDSNDERDEFATGHLLTGLKGRAVSSAMVTGFAQVVQLVFTLASVMVLARLLTPADFGLVAMVATITGFLRIFSDAGLSTVTVQKDTITHAQVSNLFWTNVALGLAGTLILLLGAPVVAWFYREPRLSRVTMALAISFLLAGSTVQHQALMKRQMRFRTIAVIQVGSIVVGGLVGMAMAWAGYGYWSLVWMQLSTSIMAFILTWSVSRWWPQLPSRDSGTHSLLGFGANLTLSTFLWSLARGSDSLLIGRAYGSAALGLYTRGAALLYRPLEQSMAPLEAVVVPTFSRLQLDPERYRRTFFQVYDVIALASFLFSGILLSLAHPLTLVVLGSQWERATPIVAAFTLVALYTPTTSVAGWLLASQGRGRELLVMGSISSLVTFVVFALGLPFGPVGVATAYSASCFLVQLPLAYHIAGRSGLISAREMWAGFFRQLPLWVVTASTTWIARELLSDRSSLAQLFTAGPIGMLAGAAFVCIYPPSRTAALNLITALQQWRGSLKWVVTSAPEGIIG